MKGTIFTAEAFKVKVGSGLKFQGSDRVPSKRKTIRSESRFTRHENIYSVPLRDKITKLITT